MNKFPWVLFGLSAFLGAYLALIVTVYLFDRKLDTYKQEALDRGYATMVVNAAGPEFKWVEPESRIPNAEYDILDFVLEDYPELPRK